MSKVKKYDTIASVLMKKPVDDCFGKEITGAKNALIMKEVAREGEANMVDKSKRSIIKKALKKIKK